MHKIWIGAILSIASISAFAGLPPPAPVDLPEPGVLGLLAAAGLAAFIVHRNRRK